MIEVMVKMQRRGTTGLAVFICALVAMASCAGAQSAMLDKVRKRGHVICGVSNNSPGFSNVDTSGKWSGFEIDFCAALASATLGRRDAVRYKTLTAAARFATLRSGDVDVLVHNTSWTLGRATEPGLRFVSPLYYEGIGLLVRSDQDIASAMELAGAAFCTLAATPAHLEIARYFGSRNMTHELLAFDTWDEAVKAFKSKRCQVLGADLSVIAAQLSSMPGKDHYMILPELIGHEPLGPVVLAGDERWFEIVRWTIFALIKAEELGLSAGNVEAERNHDNQTLQQFLGINSHIGSSLGLAQDWSYQIVRQVGNYGEIFAQNFGTGSALKMQRKLNHLWSNGGLLTAPPFR